MLLLKDDSRDPFSFASGARFGLTISAAELRGWIGQPIRMACSGLCRTVKASGLRDVLFVWKWEANARSGLDASKQDQQEHYDEDQT
jgi:hypothetical protein